jgi:PAS domain S-box-containing protein
VTDIDHTQDNARNSTVGMPVRDSARIRQPLDDLLQLALELTQAKVVLAVRTQSYRNELKACRLSGTHSANGDDNAWLPLLDILHGRDSAFYQEVLPANQFSTSALSGLPLTVAHYAAIPSISDKYGHVGWLVLADDQPKPLTSAQVKQLERLARLATSALGPEKLHDQMLLADIESRMRINGQLLHAASDLGRVGAWWVDLDSEEVYFSRVVREIHEIEGEASHSIDESLGYYAPEYQFVLRQAFLTCIETGVPYDLELELITAKGRRIWVRAVGQAVRNAAGKVIRVQGDFQDIDRYKRTQESLSELKHRLDLTLESISDGFALLDQEWRITYINRAMERLISRSRDTLLGQVVWEAIPYTKGGPFEAATRNALKEQARQTLEFIGDTSGIWLQASIYPSPDGVAIYMQDIRERKELQDKIENSERRFRAASAAVADVVWDWDLVNKVLHWNEGLHTRFGYPPEAVSSDPAWTRDLFHPDDRERMLASIWDTVNSTAEKWQETYRFKRWDGSYANVRDLGYVIRDSEGKAIRMVGAMQDETESLAYQARLEEQAALLDLSGDAIVVKGLDNKVLYWNRGAEKLYGWPAEQAIGHEITANLARIYLDPDTYYHAKAATIETGQWSGRLRHGTKYQSEIIVDSRWTLMRDTDGSPKSILTVHTDITKQLETEAQLRRAQRLEAVGQLTGGIAHDFNNLLTVIQGNAELLTEALSDDTRLQRFAQMTYTAAQRGADLTSRLLAFARKQTLEPRNVDVNVLLNEIHALIRRTLAQSIDIQLSCAPALWPANVDPAQLETALLNLCFNARDAMPHGGVLSLETCNVWLDDSTDESFEDLQPGPYVLTTVRDSGSGIPEELIDRVFEPFFTTKEPGKGSGLGLSMVYGFIKQSAGQLKIHSQHDQGTTIRLYLPKGDSSVQETKAQPEELPGTGSERILVVEDDDLVRLHVTDQLQALGYQVTAVNNGRAALEVLQADQHIDLLFTDIVMPGGISGPQLVVDARHLRPGLRALFTSGYSGEAISQQGRLEAGVQLLGKPYSRLELAQKVRQALEASESGHQA